MSVIKMNSEYIKTLKKENQSIRETLNNLEKNRQDIALNIEYDTDYYSFLQGFDYVIDKLRSTIK